LRVTRYIRQHHIGLIALFIALTGTAYAGTQVANSNSGTNVLKAKKHKKKKKLKLIPGPAGPAGPAGAQGPAGAARAYGHVYRGELVASDSTGIAAMTPGCQSGSSCTEPPAPGSESPITYCFQLSFVPTSVQVTPDGGHSNGDNSETATEVVAHVPARTTSISLSGCPPGYMSASVDATSQFSTPPVTGFYVTFN
jgi:hypothetical protein